MQVRRLFAAVSIATALFAGSTGAIPASADQAPGTSTTSVAATSATPNATPVAYTATCGDGTDGLRQVAVSPLPKDKEVQVFDKDTGGYLFNLDAGGSLTVPRSQLDGVKSIYLQGYPSKLILVENFDLSKCTQPTKVNVYTQPGEHFVNGRDWRTTCEKYSQTTRCRTEIWGTQVIRTGSKFTRTDGWVFNNLTYLASPRALWKANPLGNTGSWTASNGQKWRTECDTPLTGRNGCRSFLVDVEVISATRNPDGTWSYGALITERFNNLVLFS